VVGLPPGIKHLVIVREFGIFFAASNRITGFAFDAPIIAVGFHFTPFLATGTTAAARSVGVPRGNFVGHFAVKGIVLTIPFEVCLIVAVVAWTSNADPFTPRVVNGQALSLEPVFAEEFFLGERNFFVGGVSAPVDENGGRRAGTEKSFGHSGDLPVPFAPASCTIDNVFDYTTSATRPISDTGKMPVAVRSGHI
jgi:hypothetical protein